MSGKSGHLFLVMTLAGLMSVACADGQQTEATPPVVVQDARQSLSEPEPHSADREIIGRWIDERPFAAGRIEIFRSGDNLVIEQTFSRDGSTIRYDLVETQSPLGRRFDTAASGSDYWVIASGGDLEIRDSDGLIATARKTE